MATSNENIDIVCFELGSNQPPWEASPGSLGCDRDAIQRLAQNKIIEFVITDNKIYISGIDQVGVVKLPSGRRLVIKSKVQNLSILNWLAYLGEFPSLDSWLAGTGVELGDEIQTCIANLFLRELDKLTRFHLRKDYVPIFSSESTISGRIMTTRLHRCLHKLPKVPQFYRARTYNASYNIVLALALDKLSVLTSQLGEDGRDLLANLRNMWSEISRATNNPIGEVAEAQWASPPGYQMALQLARLILVGATINPKAGFGGSVFTISLSAIWERGLRKIVKDISSDTGWVLCPKSDHTRHWDDSDGRNDQSRWLNADIAVRCDDRCWVLDAKYKRSFGNESREDRFQMCAYALAFDADVVSLVYPVSNSVYAQRTLLETSFGSKDVVIESINLPMDAGPDICTLELRKLFVARDAKVLESRN